MRHLAGSDLLIATGNAGKFAEFSALLSPYAMRLLSLSDFNLPEPPETGLTFVENARIKARAAAACTGIATLADDSGLVVRALGGAPGIYTADWAEGGNGRSFTRAMQTTWGLLEAAGGTQPFLAEFRCALVLVWPDGEEAVFEGSLAGEVVWPMRGSFGHGYDPIFRPSGQRKTLGELEDHEKNALSHRADAARKLIAACFT